MTCVKKLTLVLPFFEVEAKKRSLANLKQNAEWEKIPQSNYGLASEKAGVYHKKGVF